MKQMNNNDQPAPAQGETPRTDAVNAELAPASVPEATATAEGGMSDAAKARWKEAARNEAEHGCEVNGSKLIGYPAPLAAPAQGETPESEAAQREFESGHGYPLAVHVEFAKRLERELAEAKAELAEYKRGHDYASLIVERDTLRQQLAAVEKELHEARVESAGLHCEMQRITAPGGELAALRLDRERLDWLERNVTWCATHKHNNPLSTAHGIKHLV